MREFDKFQSRVYGAVSLLRCAFIGSILLLMVNAGAAFADDLGDCNDPDYPADAAIAACSRIIQAGNLKGRDLAVAYRGRGAGYFRKGENDQAIADFERAIALDPTYAAAYRGRGGALGSKGELDRAMKDLDEAIRLDPKDARAFNNRGYIWQQKNDFDRAIVDFDEAIRLNPEDSKAVNNRGYVWQRKGDLDRALADHEQAIRLAPNFALAFVYRGLVFARKGDLDRAIADQTEAIRINPKYAMAYSYRGYYFDRKGDRDRAFADLNEAIRLDPKYVRAYLDRGTAWEHRSDFDRAVADYSEAIRLDPKNASAHFRRALVLTRNGAHDSAMADYNEAIRLNPTDPLAFNNRGSIFRSKGDLDRAVADFTEAIRLDPAYPAALTNRGLAYESKHDIAHAQADFQAALALPLKYENGKWAHDTAQARLAVLSSPAAVPPSPPAAPPITPAAPVTQPKATIPPPQAGSRLALVIGNGAYRNAPALPNPPNDARAVAKTLRDIGFQVIEGTDLDRGSMEKVLLEFLQRVPSASIRLLFYAGHGIQVGGNNYLVPVDAMVASKRAAVFELIDIDRILKGLDDEAHDNIIILDACRNNPFESRIAPTRAIRGGAGLAAYQSVGTGTLIAFATAPGNTAADGEGSHSPFATALLKHIATPGIEVNQMLTRVRIDVAAATERKQIPWVNSSLLGEVYLAPVPRQRASLEPPPAAPVPQPPGVTGGAKLLGQYNDWRAYAASSGGKKICFAIARPTSSETNPPAESRNVPYMFISSRPADMIKEQVSITVGYPFKPNSETVAIVGSNSFALYTQQDSAWIKTVAEETRMVNALRAGQTAVVKGVSTSGMQSTDTFSLKGFARALDRAAEECR